MRGELAEERVDLLLRPDVDAARRVEAEDGAGARGDPAGDGDLLLVAAGEPLDLALGARIDLQPPDGVVDAGLLLRRMSSGPQARGRALKGRAIFSLTERCIRSASERSPGT